MNKTLPFQALAVTAVLCVCTASRAEEVAAPTPQSQMRTAYQQLLPLFPEANQGRGIDPDGKVNEQPMTYGLVLSAESLHYRAEPNEETRRRIRAAVRWLVDNRDLDGDGKPGWGLPVAWDAFRDDSTNPPNTPYTITTAIVLEGLLDALSLPEFWKPAEADEIRALVGAVELRWCRELWVDGYSGGFFQYSPRADDANFAINAPAMFLGAMARFLKEQASSLPAEDRRLIESRAKGLASAAVSTVVMRDGCPYWDYMPQPNRLHRKSPNDLVHQVYTLWGLETYRDAGGDVTLPWTRAQAVTSVERFWRGDHARQFAQDETEVDDKTKAKPSILWGPGIALGFFARWGTAAQTNRCFQTLIAEYGPVPKLRLYPADFQKNGTFYPRHAAHALLGLAYGGFGELAQSAESKASQ